MAGPFTVESLSPHRVLAVDENDELLDRVAESKAEYGPQQDFAGTILEQLATAGVQQAHKEDRISFAAVTRWPGEYICAEGATSTAARLGPGEARRIFCRPRVRHRVAARSGRGRARSGDAGFDVADRLRVQLRGPRIGVQPARSHPGSQSAHERRPPHGRRTEEHGQGQPVRHLRRARHRDPDGGLGRVPRARRSR